MTNRLHVANLNSETTVATLSSAFQREGREVVRVQLVMSRRPGRSRGFAFVELASPADALASLAAVHGSTIDGREVRVTLAHPPKSRFGGHVGAPATLLRSPG